MSPGHGGRVIPFGADGGAASGWPEPRHPSTCPPYGPDAATRRCRVDRVRQLSAHDLQPVLQDRRPALVEPNIGHRPRHPDLTATSLTLAGHGSKAQQPHHDSSRLGARRRDSAFLNLTTAKSGSCVHQRHPE